MNQEKYKSCGICRAEAELKSVDFPGYIAGKTYDIYECPNCNSSFVAPLEVDESIYDYIYSQSKELVGYERYHRYAELVKKFNNPSRFLATTEPSYWSVISEIKKDWRDPGSLDVLEIGSGLGYLTYSLNKAGYRCTGIDISDEAVTSAERRYGSYFKTENIFSLTEEEKYDYVIIMDVIEHVVNPVEFIEAATKLLKPEGRLLVTTPNKDSAPVQNSLWQSDAPPVHLWFFSEKSMIMLCEQISCKSEFVNFTKFNNKFFSPSYSSSLEALKETLPRLDNYGVARRESRVESVKSKFLNLKLRYFLSYVRRRLLKKDRSEKSTTMCIIISKY